MTADDIEIGLKWYRCKGHAAEKDGRGKLRLSKGDVGAADEDLGALPSGVTGVHDGDGGRAGDPGAPVEEVPEEDSGVHALPAGAEGVSAGDPAGELPGGPKPTFD